MTSATLRQTLISFVARELNTTYKSALEDPALRFPSPDAIDRAIKAGFVRLDNEIVHESVKKVKKAQSKVAAAELLAPALSGSCALLSFYDSRSKLLRVACTGDSRAVLGRRGPNGKWTATPLSEDQTGGTTSRSPDGLKVPVTSQKNGNTNSSEITLPGKDMGAFQADGTGNQH